MDRTPVTADDCTIWTCNGACTDQAKVETSDIYLVPRKVFPDAVRGSPHVMVVCEAITPSMEPAKGNCRAECADIMERMQHHEPHFGLEQEYIMLGENGDPCEVASENACYCGRGALALPPFMREIMGDHYAYCLASGIKISGMNVESGVSQGEFQIGPCKGINAGDHMVAARHLLHKCAQKYRVGITFADVCTNGVMNGMHCNFSTKHTRDDGGLTVLEKMCRKLADKHKDILARVGGQWQQRLNGGDGDISDGSKCTYAVADRGASIRIPRNVGIVAKGYLEHRCPAGNSDPYEVTSVIMKVCAEALI